MDIDLYYQGFDAELAALPGPYTPPAWALLVAAEQDGRLLGCVGVRPLRTPGDCEMKRLYLRSAVRGMGAWAAAAVAAIETSTGAGYLAMRLDTLVSMLSARALYRRLGFEPTPAYYKTPVAETTLMRKVLQIA